MTWAQLLKRVFGIDIETCRACGATVRIIACIEDPVVIEKILTRLDSKNPCTASARSPSCLWREKSPLALMCGNSPDPPGPMIADTTSK